MVGAFLWQSLLEELNHLFFDPSVSCGMLSRRRHGLKICVVRAWVSGTMYCMNVWQPDRCKALGADAFRILVRVSSEICCKAWINKIRASPSAVTWRAWGPGCTDEHDIMHINREQQRRMIASKSYFGR